MLEVLKKTANETYTENGALTHRSTGKDCLDLFAAIGALRRESDLEIERPGSFTHPMYPFLPSVWDTSSWHWPPARILIR